jgi:hypothetical protein
MLHRSKKVNYDEDDLWSQWNVAAKIIILTQPSQTPPMGQYYVEHRSTGSAETAFSSLATSNKSAPAVGRAALEGPTNNGAAAAQPCPTLHARAFPNSENDTTGSEADSMAKSPMFTMEQWEEFKEKNGMRLGSKSWPPGTVEVQDLEVEDEAGDRRREVGLNLHQVIAACVSNQRVPLTCLFPNEPPQELRQEEEKKRGKKVTIKLRASSERNEPVD